MYNGQRVVVCMPAYNEAEGIGQVVTDFRSLDCVDEVVVADNNSTDGTASIAADAGATVVEERAQGYGNACQRAMAEAASRGDLITLVESDGTFVAKDIRKLLEYSVDFDVVFGTRTASEMIWNDANMGPFLRWGNWAIAKLVEVLYNAPNLTDVGCTFRLITADAYEQIEPDLTVGGSHFSPEMMIRVVQHGIPMIEVPVNYRDREGESKITGDRWPAFKLGLVMIAYVVLERLS